jgi:hypothetical protein
MLAKLAVRWCLILLTGWKTKLQSIHVTICHTSADAADASLLNYRMNPYTHSVINVEAIQSNDAWAQLCGFCGRVVPHCHLKAASMQRPVECARWTNDYATHDVVVHQMPTTHLDVD